MDMSRRVQSIVKREAPRAFYNVNLWAITHWDHKEISPFTTEFWDKETVYGKEVIAEKNFINADCGVEFPLHNYYRSLAFKAYDDAHKKPELFPVAGDVGKLRAKGVKRLWGWAHFIIDEVDDGYTGYSGKKGHPSQSETRYIHQLISGARAAGLNGMFSFTDGPGSEIEAMNVYAFGRFCINPSTTPEMAIDEFSGYLADKTSAPLLAQVIRFIENNSTWEASIPRNFQVKKFDCSLKNAAQALETLASVRAKQNPSFPLPEEPAEYFKKLRSRLEDINAKEASTKAGFQTLAVYLHPSWHLETERDYNFWKACGYNTISFLVTGTTVDDAILDPFLSRIKRAQLAGFKVEIVILSNIGANGHGFDPRNAEQMQKRLGDIEMIVSRLSAANIITLVAGDPGGSPVSLGEDGVDCFLKMALKVQGMAKKYAPNSLFNVNLWALAYWDNENTSPFTIDFWDKETSYGKKFIGSPELKDIGIEFPMHNYYRSLALNEYARSNRLPDLFPNKGDIRKLQKRGLMRLWAWPYFLIDEVDDGYTGYLASKVHPTQSETRYIYDVIKNARALGLNGVVVNASIDSGGTESEALNIYASGRFCQDPTITPEEVISEFAAFVADEKTAPVLTKVLKFIENHSTWEASLPESYRIQRFGVEYPNASAALADLATVRERPGPVFPLPISFGEFLYRIKARLTEID
jgi:hypothetical protein